MEIVESVNHYFETVYHIKDGWHIVATVYLRKDAETVKAALEASRAKEEKDNAW